jgi:hypothetical protein
VLVERVIPAPEIKNRIADLAVGLVADCDRPENDVEKIMRANLAGAQKLPFVAFVTHDGKWVEGYSGAKRPGDFLAVLEKAEDTPYLKATPAVQKKLAGLAAKAEKAAKKGDWRTVMKSAQAADKTTGRCPERTQIQTLVDSARAWAAAQFTSAIKHARTKDGVAASRKALSAVKKQFSGQPEASVAHEGSKALKRLERIRKVEAKGSAVEDLREKAARDFKGTIWEALFNEKAVVPDADGEVEKEDEETEIEVE